ncbi:MAG: hypothetical protein MJ247_04370 [Alphaproteobacteria bacterium]|nr:hypothetical protein [Alphaproteobacteria bacterium]
MEAEQNTSIFVKVLLPNKPFLVREFTQVIIPAVDGPYSVLLNRAPCLKLLKAGVLTLVDDDGTSEYNISEGIAKIREDGCTILVQDITLVNPTKKNDTN